MNLKNCWKKEKGIFFLSLPSLILGPLLPPAQLPLPSPFFSFLAEAQPSAASKPTSAATAVPLPGAQPLPSRARLSSPPPTSSRTPHARLEQPPPRARSSRDMSAPPRSSASI